MNVHWSLNELPVQFAFPCDMEVYSGLQITAGKINYIISVYYYMGFLDGVTRHRIPRLNAHNYGPLVIFKSEIPM